MPLVAFTNTKKHTVYVGNKSIKAGETREVEEALSPNFQPAPTEAVDEIDPLETILSGNVEAVLAFATKSSDDDLHALQDMEEESEAPRKGVLEGLLKIALSRADLGAAE
ncbi:MAG: hypothetical protein COB22_07845 [Cycloclasticus sp.]|nr:MAG: hypothetical protein COB22_07845 [Cycloclasticus sp.]